MRLDLHIHSKYSADSEIGIKAIIKVAKKLGLNGIAITDHNSVKSHTILKRTKVKGMLLVPGIEVSTSEGHVLGCGISGIIKKGLSVKETIGWILDAGGLPVAAHPYRRVSGIGEKETLVSGFGVIETFNARSIPRGNKKACDLAKRMDASVTGGSDGHTLEEVGMGFTDIPDSIETVDQLLDAIRDGRTVTGGYPASVRKVVEKTTGNVVKFVRRGMKKM